MKKRPIISIVLLIIFFFIPLTGGILLSRHFNFTVSEDVVMCFTVTPIEIIIFIAIILLWRKNEVHEWGDEKDARNGGYNG